MTLENSKPPVTKLKERIQIERILLSTPNNIPNLSLKSYELDKQQIQDITDLYIDSCLGSDNLSEAFCCLGKEDPRCNFSRISLKKAIKDNYNIQADSMSNIQIYNQLLQQDLPKCTCCQQPMEPFFDLPTTEKKIQEILKTDGDFTLAYNENNKLIGMIYGYTYAQQSLKKIWQHEWENETPYIKNADQRSKKRIFDNLKQKIELLGLSENDKYYCLALIATKENLENRGVISRKMLKEWFLSLNQQTIDENLVIIETGWQAGMHKLLKASKMIDIPGVLNPDYPDKDFEKGDYTIMVGNFQEVKTNIFKYARLNNL